MSDPTSKLKDAMGNTLVVGNTYGYSVSESGRTTTVVGRLKSIGKTLSSVEVIHRRNFIYGEEYVKTWGGGDKKPVNVQSCKLFPVILDDGVKDAKHHPNIASEG